MASGIPLLQAVEEAQEYTYETLQRAFHPGMGQFIPDRLFWARDIAEENDNDHSSAN